MIDREILRKVKRIEIQTNRLVNDALGGEYHSVFKGRGMEFDEVREYQFGDDIRTIDWNVSARMRHLYVKRYVEERELTVMLLVDLSASGNFGTVRRFKNELSAELGALLAFSAIKNNDRVGAVIFTDTVEKYIAPKKGKTHVLRVVREVLAYQPKQLKTNIAAAIRYLNRVVTKRCVVFLISDFFDEGYEQALRVANQRHDLIAFPISDPRDMTIPSAGLLQLRDPETGKVVWVDSSLKSVRSQFERLSRESIENRNRIFRKNGIEFVEITTDRPYDVSLVKFFRQRAKRIHA
ncbi:MAG: DUF58 domain-containing protein [Acidobacteriota bacterium]